MAEIVVDLGQLRETCVAVRLDTELGLQPGLSASEGRIQHGVRFGRSSPSGEADAAAQALRETLRRHKSNAERHLATATHLVAVLDRIITNYQDADAIARLNVEAVQAELAAALPVPSVAPDRRLQP